MESTRRSCGAKFGTVHEMNQVWVSSGWQGYLSLVLLLEFEATLDAAPRLQEDLPLRVVGQVVDEQTCRVHAQVQQAFGKNLHPERDSFVADLHIFFRETVTWRDKGRPLTFLRSAASL